MDKVGEARILLKMAGVPKTQQADICCYVLLAMTDMKPDMSWKEARNEWICIHDIIQFSNAFYGTTYAENSQETILKEVMDRFRMAALIEDNGKETNSPDYRYRITEETMKFLKPFQFTEWPKSRDHIRMYYDRLIDLCASPQEWQ